MKKTLYTILIGSLLLSQVPLTALAATQGVVKVNEDTYYIDTETQNAVSSQAKQTTSTETFKKKTTNEKNKLSSKEKDIINELEDYFISNSNPKQRGFNLQDLENTFLDLAFDLVFDAEHTIISDIQELSFAVNADKNYIDWYSSLSNTSTKYMTAYDEPTGKNIQLQARYIDNKSGKTAILANGFRASRDSVMGQAKMFSDLGFNVLLTDSRAQDGSEGQYVTFGYYEKDDVNGWIDSIVAESPNQEITLFGRSMGGSTVIMSQDTPHPNVVAVIDDCTYATLEQQLKDTLHLVTYYFQYVPLLYNIDWYNKEDQLIKRLNDEKIKPVLKFDIHDVSPLETIKKSTTPNLFIHGEADFFIKPVASSRLYGSASGYKEMFTIPEAGHANSFEKDTDTYVAKVTTFLENVENMKGQYPYIAANQNLLVDPTFNKTTTSNYVNWETSTTTNDSDFSNAPLSKTSGNEFVLKKNKLSSLVTAKTENKGITFFNRYNKNFGAVGQNVNVVEGETYKLSLSTRNMTTSLLTYPALTYGFGQDLTTSNVKLRSPIHLNHTYTAKETGAVKIKIGAALGRWSVFGTPYANTNVRNLSLINTDTTPPEPVIVSDFSSNGQKVSLRGMGEPNTTIIIKNEFGKIIETSTTNEQGSFGLSINTVNDSIFHVVNQDIKGNQSASTVLVVQ